jgi:Tfp pilus assembly protein PilF
MNGWVGLAGSYLRTRRFEQGEKAVKEALKIDPQFSLARDIAERIKRMCGLSDTYR